MVTSRTSAPAPAGALTRDELLASALREQARTQARDARRHAGTLALAHARAECHDSTHCPACGREREQWARLVEVNEDARAHARASEGVGQ